MPNMYLQGSLRCRDVAEARIVEEHLPTHITLSRAEAGCIAFNVEPTADALVWKVFEVFADEASFEAHQQRVSSSDWGRATAGIERRYVIRRKENS